MTRGRRPLTAIGEAQLKAVSLGFVVTGFVTDMKSSYDFMVHDKGGISLVRVRRLRQHGYRPELIQRSCAQQIKELRELVVPAGIVKELWVRGPERAWHRYSVLPETVEEVVIVPNLVSSKIGVQEQKEKGTVTVLPVKIGHMMSSSHPVSSLPRVQELEGTITLSELPVKVEEVKCIPGPELSLAGVQEGEGTAALPELPEKVDDAGSNLKPEPASGIVETPILQKSPKEE